MSARFRWRGALTLACIGGLAFSTVDVRAQQAAPATVKPANDLDSKYQEAMQAFNSGDYAKTIADLNVILSQAGEGAQLQSVLYTLGAAYFNSHQYPQAIDALKKFVTKYPQSTQREDAIFSIGQAAMAIKDFKTAEDAFKQLANSQNYRADAALAYANACKEGGQTGEAIDALSKMLAGGINDEATANAAMTLATLYADKAQGEKAISLLQQLRAHATLLDNPLRLNGLALQLGDDFLKREQPELALQCYQAVQSKEQIIKLSQQRVAALRKKVQDNLARMRVDPSQNVKLVAEDNDLNKAADETEKMIADIQKQEDFQPPLWVRLASALSASGHKWEAVTVYDEFLRKYPQSPLREPVLYGLIIASVDADRAADKTRALSEQYLKEFPDKPNAAAVGYLLGATALQGHDPAAAESYFGRMLDTQPNSTYREQMRFLLGNARFDQSKFDAARKDYDTYIKDYPNGSHIEEVIYRVGLTSLFSGKYEQAMKELNDYLKKYPHGEFAADAKYRLMVCKYAGSLYDDVIADADAWTKEYPGHELTGEVLAQKADALAGKDKSDEALETYIQSYKKATSDQVMNYSLFEAQKLLQKAGDWNRMIDMFKEFVQNHPDNPTAVVAVYWIGKGMTKNGQTDEAKQYVAGVVKKYIADPSRPAVEQLLTLLAQLCMKHAPGAPVPTDPGAELDGLLGLDTSSSPLVKARILFARAELAKLKRQPDEETKDLQAIVDEAKPEDLSASILARVGDYLLGKNDLDKAAAYYSQIMTAYPTSDFLEYAYNGLGQIAYKRGQYAEAVTDFDDAINKGAASAKLKDVTLGKASALLALGRYDEAEKLFRDILSTREWRGEAYAQSLYSLGEIMQKRGDLAKAIGSYQQVYVGYGRYLPWVAKAYIKSGECFEKLGKAQEAVNTYREMIHNTGLSAFPEYKEAQQRLEALGNQ
jgi:TolA-binding protein